MNRKVVLVTGASGGIGEACARRLAQAGFTVLAHAGRGMEKVQQLSRDLCQAGLDVHPCQADLSKSSSVRRLAEEILSVHHSLYGMVHCAGVAYSGLLTDMSDEDWERIMDTNLSSAFYLCRAFLPGMIRQQEGSIVLISSMWGQAGASCEAAYSASKAGMIGLGRALAKEVGPSGIRVNCVAPGVIDTPMMSGYSEADKAELADTAALGRLGRPEDVAGVCAFLMGNESAFITGQVIGVDGGFL
jgi:3-oxoacyl-[acyl-carrier protein] reductase